MNLEKAIKYVLIVLALICTALIAGKAIKNLAVDGCLKASGLTEIQDGSGKFTYPNKDVYSACMTDKGYSTDWQ